MTYEEAEALLGKKESRYLRRKTRLKRVDEGIAVIYWRTAVVTFFPNGTFSYRAGRWRTVTTKRRMNQYGPPGFRVFQRDWEWYVETPDGYVIPFQDDIRLSYRHGTMTSRVRCLCVCGCEENAVTYEAGIPTCADCAVYTITADGGIVCGRITNNFNACHACGALISWEPSPEGDGYVGWCECGDAWTDRDGRYRYRP